VDTIERGKVIGRDLAPAEGSTGLAPDLGGNGKTAMLSRM
jgi:hypothetical protein